MKDIKFIDKLKMALQYGYPMIIENVVDKLDYILDPVINK